MRPILVTEAIDKIQDEYFDMEAVEEVKNYIDFLESQVYSSQ